jgi:hypothetical protein
MRYPAWKYLLILVVLTISTLYALPSLYPDEPAVQISGAKAGTQIDQSIVQKKTVTNELIINRLVLQFTLSFYQAQMLTTINLGGKVELLNHDVHKNLQQRHQSDHYPMHHECLE